MPRAVTLHRPCASQLLPRFPICTAGCLASISRDPSGGEPLDPFYARHHRRLVHTLGNARMNQRLAGCGTQLRGARVSSGVQQSHPSPACLPAPMGTLQRTDSDLVPLRHRLPGAPLGLGSGPGPRLHPCAGQSPQWFPAFLNPGHTSLWNPVPSRVDGLCNCALRNRMRQNDGMSFPS